MDIKRRGETKDLSVSIGEYRWGWVGKLQLVTEAPPDDWEVTSTIEGAEKVMEILQSSLDQGQKISKKVLYQAQLQLKDAW